MRKKFAWFFCIFMSSLVLLSCSEDNKKGEEPGDGTGGGTPEGDTKTYFETTYSDLSAYVDKDVSEIWAAVGNASKDEENNCLLYTSVLPRGGFHEDSRLRESRSLSMR